MTDTGDGPADVSSRAAFSEALGTLLRRAHDAGIDVRGGWDCRDDGGAYPEWSVEITRVERAEDG